MMLMWFLVGVLGAIMGSFISMLVYRIPRQEEIVFKPSHCPSCQHPLGVFSLIPILSFMMQKGVCRYCSKAISLRYFLCEIACLFLFLLCFWAYGLSFLFIKTVFFLSAMVLLWAIDWTHFILPDVVTLPLIVLGLALGTWEGRGLEMILATVVGFGVYFLIGVLAKWIYKKEAMGMGDMKLGAAIGAWWGLHFVILSIYLSFLIGGLVGIILIVGGFKKKTDYIPFGPAMILASVLVLWVGETLWALIFG